MRPNLVTALWVTDAAPGEPPTLLERTNVAIVKVTRDEVEAAIREARDGGGVVVLDSDSQLERMLALGADELLAWDCPPGIFDGALLRARARATWRRAEGRGGVGEELPSLALLGASMGHEIRNPLTAATLNCTVLVEVVPSLTRGLEEICEAKSPSLGDASASARSSLPRTCRKSATRSTTLALRCGRWPVS